MRRSLKACHLALTMLLLSGVRGNEPETAPANDPTPVLLVDRKAGSVELRAILVHPVRNIEIFGCHISGPNHETVVQFLAEGPQLYDALVEIGGRPPGFWNATSEDDLRRVLGDRFVVLLRWEDARGVHELPAERVFVESGTGFSAFVRGFTFAAEKVLMGDPPERRIPRTVEITIGDPTRQGSVYSILFHPKDIGALTRWMPPFEVDPLVLGDLKDLVTSETDCTLTIRRVSGEVELLKTARLHEKESRRRELIDQTLLPIARQIDELKAEHEVRIGRIQAILDRLESEEEDQDPDRRQYDTRELQHELRRGRATVALIWERYLELFARQESFKVHELRQRKGLAAEVLNLAVNAFEHGFKTELEIARVQLRQTLLASAYDNDISIIELNGAIFWDQQDADQSRRQLEEMRRKEGRDDCYFCQLEKETILKREAEIRRDQATKARLASFSTEYRLRVDGTWGQEKVAVLRRRKLAYKRVDVELGELDRVRLLSNIRWTRNFLEDQDRDPQEIDELRQKLEDLEAEEKQLREHLRLRREGLKTSGD